MKRMSIVLVVVVSCLCAFSFANAYTTVPQSFLIPSTGYYTTDLGNIAVMTGGGSSANVGDSSGKNDDGFMGPINLGFKLDFYGGEYEQFWANNNGNVSFTGGISSYEPDGPLGADVPIISPFFADVDTRGLDSGVMYIQSNIPGQWIITWDNVGYYDSNDGLLNSFQLVLRSAAFNVPVGEGQFGFFYKTMDWEITETSTTAAVGFGNGIGDGIVLAGSNTPGLAPVLSNHHIWFNSDEDVIIVVPPSVVPEPGTMMLLSMGMLGAAFLARRKS